MIRIRQAAIDAIVAHARAEAPRECCGLLVGSGGLIEEAAPARNLRPGPTRYLVDPADHFAVLRAARAAGRQVMGAYHSHPAAPAVPSATDLAEASYPEYIYLIVAPAADGGGRADLRAYRLTREAFEPVPLIPVA